jgi:subtilisin-like proprotein convertase family protein
MLGCLASVLATASVYGQTNYTQSTAITVRDNNTATPYPSRITVSGIVGALQKVTVTLSGVTHGYPDDMDIFLVAPSGDRIALMSDAGGQFDQNTTEITLDSTSNNILPDEAAIVSGTYRPANYDIAADPMPAPFPAGATVADLGVLVGDTANGNWDLYVVDDTEIDAGTIRTWTLTLITRPIITIRAEDEVISTDEDESLTIPVRVVDSDTPPGNLTLGTANRNNDLFTVTFGGSGTNRTATIVPRQNAHGEDFFNITVTDGSGFTASSPEIRLVIEPENDAPTLVLGANTVTIPQGGISAPITAVVRDIDFSADADRTQIRLGAFSDNQSVVASSNVFFTINTATPGTNSLRIVPTGAATGNATITIFAIDPEGATNETVQTIAVTVNPIAQPVAGNPTTINLPDGTGGPQVGSPYPSVVNVSGVSGSVGRVDVSLIDVEHTNPEDIGVMLVSPDGRAVVLMRSAGGDTDVNDIRLTFSTLGTANISDAGPLTTSTNLTEDHGNGDFPVTAPAGFPYADEIDAFQGALANGRWELYAYDTTDNGASGMIRGGWVMTIYPAPTIANIPTQTLQEGSAASPPGVVPVVPEDVNTITVNISVSDMDGSVTNIQAFVSNPQPGTNTATPVIEVETVPANGTVSGNNAVVRISTIDDLNGTNEVTVIVQDNSGSFRATNRFNVVVIPINDPPFQTVIPKQVTAAGEPILLIPFTIGDIETPAGSLNVGVTSDNTKLLPPGAIVLTNIDADEKAISIFPAGAVAAQAFVTVSVTNGNGSVTSQTFDLTVTQPASPLYEQTTQVPISDDAITSSTIGVSNLVSTIAQIQVTLYGINHTNLDDIDVMLVSPNGTTTTADDTALTFMSDVGGSLGGTNLVLVFNDDAREGLPDNTQIYSGVYLPTDSGGADDDFTGTTVPEENATTFADFIGEDPNGTWTLYVRDDTDSERGGTITAWQLSIRTVPELGAIANQTTDEDTPISFRITLGDFQPGVDLDFDLAHVSGPALVDSFTVTRSETDNTATVTLTPEANQFGAEVLTLTVTDEDGNDSSQTFTFNVTSRNDPPTISAISSPRTTPAATPVSINFTVSDAPNESTPAQITTSATSDNQTLVPNGNITVTTDPGNPANRTITITPAGLNTGSANITITARDASGSGLTATRSFVLNVTPSVGGINPQRIGIPAFGAASPYPSIIDLTGAGIDGRVSNARVILDGFSHTFPDDVDVLLVAPNNAAVMLMGDAGGDPDVTNRRLTFRNGGALLPDETIINNGEYAPANYADTLGGNDIFPSGSPNPPAAPAGGYSTDLTDFDGINPNGQWRLYVRDDTTGESGEILRGWILILETGPTVSNPGQQSFPEDTTPIRIPFTVSDEDSSADELDVTVTIDDTAAPGLIADVDLDSTGFNYTLLLQPATNRPVSLTVPETNTVTLTVTDERGDSASQSFRIIITPVDDPPTIARSASSVTINEDGSTSFQITIRDVDSVLRTNELQIATSNSALLPVAAPNITISSPTGRDIPRDTDGVLTINVTPVADQNGVADLTFTIRDRNGAWRRIGHDNGQG